MLTAPTKPQVRAHCLRPVHLLQWAERQSKCLKNVKSSSPQPHHCRSRCVATCPPHTPRHNLLVHALLQMQQVCILLRTASVQSHLVLRSFQPPHKATVLPGKQCQAVCALLTGFTRRRYSRTCARQSPLLRRSDGAVATWGTWGWTSHQAGAHHQPSGAPAAHTQRRQEQRACTVLFSRLRSGVRSRRTTEETAPPNSTQLHCCSTHSGMPCLSAPQHEWQPARRHPPPHTHSPPSQSVA